MAKEYTIVKMDQNLKENGCKIIYKVLDVKNGRKNDNLIGISQIIVDNINWVKNMDLEFLFGKINQNMKGNLAKIRYKVKVNILGLMVEIIKDNGKIIKCKELVNLIGQMEES